MALCPTCRTPIPCHCHLTPPVQIRPDVYTTRPQETAMTDQLAPAAAGSAAANEDGQPTQTTNA